MIEGSRLVFSKHKARTLVEFYVASGINSIFERKFKQIAENLFSQGLIYNLRDLKISILGMIRIGDDPFKTESGELISAVNPVEILSNNRTIYISEAIIKKTLKKLFKDKFDYENPQPQLSDSMVRYVTGLIIHEITHIIMVDKNQSFILLEQNSRKVKSQMMALLGEENNIRESRNAVIVHAELNKFMISFLELIIYEGFADFNRFFYTRNLNFREENVRYLYAKVYHSAQEVNKIFGGIFNGYLKKMEGSKDIIKINKGIEQNLKEAKWKSYLMGAHIFHLILFYHKNIELRELMQMNYLKVMRLYEESCNSLHWRPIISLFTDEGVIAYQKYSRLLEDFRKNSKEYVQGQQWPKTI